MLKICTLINKVVNIKEYLKVSKQAKVKNFIFRSLNIFFTQEPGNICKMFH